MKRSWIKDQQRESFLNVTYNRIRKGKSILLIGNYGCGKTEFLNQISPKSRRKVLIDSLAPLTNILYEIASVTSAVNGNPKHGLRYMYKKQIIESSAEILVVIDEAGDMNTKTWPYIKRLMNANVPFVMAGLPTVINFLDQNHPDILSRFKILDMKSLSAVDLKGFYKDVEHDALDILYNAAGGNMRKFDEILDDCRDKLEELKRGGSEIKKITVEIAEMFIPRGR